ncbi:uncharacterized protein LOC144739209 isoform X2 [Lampetra planeri]
MESLLGPVLEFLRGRQSSLLASLVAVCVFAGHELFTVVSTPCPCSPGRNPVLAAVAALGPALLLLLAGLAVNNHTQRSLTGCVSNSVPIGAAICCALSLQALTRSLLAPVVWLIAALLRGNYYECGASEFQSGARVFDHPNVSQLLPRESLARVPCDSLRLSAWLSVEDERQIRSDLMEKMQFESEVKLTQSVTHSVSQSLTQSLSQSVSHSVSHSVSQLLAHSLSHSVSQSLSHSLRHSLRHSLSQLLAHSLSHSVSHSLTRSLTHSPLTHSLSVSRTNGKFAPILWRRCSSSQRYWAGPCCYSVAWLPSSCV